MPRTLNAGMIGYGFMPKAHSSAPSGLSTRRWS